ncbi:MAG: SAM-dependent methyltransferase, partial [Acaryochloridaceae cyanobacterium CSU_3_4]|nr:SAM-dependent methyltransferase [Acaryochloridaceae cyanobacterium CSU_3_4]
MKDFYGADLQPVKALEAIANPDCGYLYYAKAADFAKIPGSAIAYWITRNFLNIFENFPQLEEDSKIAAGISTGENDRFIFYWHESKLDSIAFNEHRRESNKFRFVPHNKGGEFRKWYGNQNHILAYDQTAILEMQEKAGFRHDGSKFYFKECLSWSKITSSMVAFRYYQSSFSFDSAGICIFPSNKERVYALLGILNSKVVTHILDIINPTL